jgi:hypothetical protein
MRGHAGNGKLVSMAVSTAFRGRLGGRGIGSVLAAPSFDACVRPTRHIRRVTVTMAQKLNAARLTVNIFFAVRRKPARIHSCALRIRLQSTIF